MPTKSEVLFRDSAGYHKIDLKLNPEMAIYTRAGKYLEQLDNVCGTCLKPLKGKMFYPMNPPKCQDCIQIQRFERALGLFTFTWEHIAERLEIRQVLHAFGWPRTPFAELLKRQARAIRANA